jgi:hypothetical protein
VYIDDLIIYRGKDYKVNDKIIIRQPTVGEITDYGEQNFFSMVHMLTNVGADLKWQLDEVGIDYTKINDYELFYHLCKIYKKEQTQIIFYDLDLTLFEWCNYTPTGEDILYDKYNDIILDRYAYAVIMEVLRKTYNLKRNNELPGNEATRLILIEDAKDEYEINKNKPYISQLFNLISTMVNSDGFKHDEVTVFDMKIGAFMNSVKRIEKIKRAEILLQSGYSGYGVNLKEIDKKELDYMGEL